MPRKSPKRTPARFTSTFPLLRLPNELLLLVGSSTTNLHDLNRLVQINRFFWTLLNPLLYKKGLSITVDPNKNNPNHGTLLHTACNLPSPATLRRLIALSTRINLQRFVNVTNKESRTALHILSSRFWDTGVHAHYRSHLHSPEFVPAHRRLRPEQVSSVKYINTLLQFQNIELEGIDVLGETPLHRAARFGSKDVVETLLRHGAKAGKEMFFHSIMYNPMELTTVTLLEMGRVDGRAVNEDGISAIALAIMAENCEVVWRLAKAGAVDSNYKDPRSGKTLLQTALHDTEAYAIIRQILVKYGADINARNARTGRTALHAAVMEGYVKGRRDLLVRSLLDAGADVMIRDWDGKTALQLLGGTATVAKPGRVTVARILVKAEIVGRMKKDLRDRSYRVFSA